MFRYDVDEKLIYNCFPNGYTSARIEMHVKVHASIET